MLYLSPHLPSIRPCKAEAEQAAIPPGNQQKFNPSSGASNTDEAVPPWMSGGATVEDVDGMTAQQQDFVQGLGGQGNANQDPASLSPTEKRTGNGASVETPDTGKNPSPGYESDTAEDLGKVIEAETGDKAPAQTGDYEQEGGRASQGEQQNIPQEGAAPHAQSGQPKIESVPLETLPKNAQDAFVKYEQNGWKGNVPGQTAGTKAGGKYGNQEKYLPSQDYDGKPITYRKFDVNDRVPGQGRDAQRFVVGSDGSVYYTDEHYNGFVKIK